MVRAPPNASVAGFACSCTLISAHPSHGSLPHRELHRRPQRHCSHAVPPSFRRTPHTVHGPMWESTEGPSGRVRMQFRPNFGAPLTRFVTLQGSSTEGPICGSRSRLS
eukprot:4882454-Pyramimonas_sp.AAC.1